MQGVVVSLCRCVEILCNCFIDKNVYQKPEVGFIDKNVYQKPEVGFIDKNVYQEPEDGFIDKNVTIENQTQQCRRLLRNKELNYQILLLP